MQASKVRAPAHAAHHEPPRDHVVRDHRRRLLRQLVLDGEANREEAHLRRSPEPGADCVGGYNVPLKLKKPRYSICMRCRT